MLFKLSSFFSCLKVLNTLYEGWNEAIRSMNKTTPPAEAKK